MLFISSMYYKYSLKENGYIFISINHPTSSVDNSEDNNLELDHEIKISQLTLKALILLSHSDTF